MHRTLQGWNWPRVLVAACCLLVVLSMAAPWAEAYWWTARGYESWTMLAGGGALWVLAMEIGMLRGVSRVTLLIEGVLVAVPAVGLIVAFVVTAFGRGADVWSYGFYVGFIGLCGAATGTVLRLRRAKKMVPTAS